MKGSQDRDKEKGLRGATMPQCRASSVSRDELAASTPSLTAVAGRIQPTSSRRAAKASLCERKAMSFFIAAIKNFNNSTTVP
jgi:hypothetical protein